MASRLYTLLDSTKLVGKGTGNSKGGVHGENFATEDGNIPPFQINIKLVSTKVQMTITTKLVGEGRGRELAMG